MLAFVCVSVVLGAAPTAATAQKLSRDGAWDELYLGFAKFKATAFSTRDRKAIGRALADGCRALQSAEPTLAVSLGEKAIEFDVTLPAVDCLATTATALQQPETVEGALRAGLKKFPSSSPLALRLGRFFFEEGDYAQALQALQRVAPTAPEFTEAAALRGRAETRLQERLGGGAQAPTPPRREPMPGTGSSSPVVDEPRVDAEGRRIRAGRSFRFRYFNGQRDFGQRAEYEGRAAELLESAKLRAESLLGQKRTAPVDVILYSREEFALHHGSSVAQRVAGFYSDHAIRLNDSAELTEENRITLVHEFVHAIVDELASSHAERIPTWLNEGLAESVEWNARGGSGAPLGEATAVRGAAKARALPSLRDLDRGPLALQQNAGLAYAYSALAVRALISRSSMSDLLAHLAELGKGADFRKSFERHFGKTPEDFETDLGTELSSR